jgi:CheY-like chemotaxis protein
MTRDAAELLIPRIALVDDERQIHASIRLRLGRECDLVSFTDAREALAAITTQAFDLCIADIHMPHLDGLAFIDAATKIDPALGFVVLSAFDTEENLRRTIPLRVYDFISKPLPERDGFEARIPGWVERTRHGRRERALAGQATAIDRELDAALLERDVELIASESARDALLQTASLLTTVHAHLVTACLAFAARAKADPGLASLARNLDAGRKAAEAAATVAEEFFDSAYGQRDASPALLDTGLQHAIAIACRAQRAEENRKAVDCAAIDDQLPIRGLSGIDFLLMAVPAIGLALAASEPDSTLRIRGEPLARLESAARDARFKHHLWLNRRAALGSQPSLLLSITASAPPFSRAQAEAWLKGDLPGARIPARGLVRGIAQCKGLLGLGVAPHATQFHLVLALPT